MFKYVPAGPDDPLFISDSVRRKPLTHSKFVNRIKQLLEAIGVNEKFYSGHSFRRGGATWAHSIGISDALIMLMGDWHSNAYQLYIQVTDGAKKLATSTMISAVTRGDLGQTIPRFLL
jgi:integrase